jgi:predicted transcriptional regulator
MEKIWKTDLKQKRENAGLTQVELAKKLKCPQSRIAFYEGGYRKPCDLHRLAKINKLLGPVTWERL